MRAQPRFGGIDLARGLQLGFRREQVVLDAEGGEILADHVHHRRDRAGAEEDQPLGLGRGGILIPEFGSERLAHGLQVFAGIEAFGMVIASPPLSLASASRYRRCTERARTSTCAPASLT